MANFRFGSNDYTVNIRTQHSASLLQGWGVHRLVLGFEVTAHDKYTEDAPFLVSGNLWTSDLPSPASWVGVLHAPGPIGLKPFTTMVTLETSVTDQQLRGLEKTRAGADLTLRADLTLTGLAETRHWPVASDSENIRIPHAAWSNQLAQVDAGAFVDVLVPITTVEARATAARRIREAKTAIRDQRYEHTLTLARQALDAVREERWAVLIQSAYNLFSGAPHDDTGTTENFTWTRADAVAAVATAASLLARLEDLP